MKCTFKLLRRVSKKGILTHKIYVSLYFKLAELFSGENLNIDFSPYDKDDSVSVISISPLNCSFAALL